MYPFSHLEQTFLYVGQLRYTKALSLITYPFYDHVLQQYVLYITREEQNSRFVDPGQ